MNDVVCPSCGTAFTIDEASYAAILKQVRDREFDKEVHERLAAAEDAKKAEIALVRAEADKAGDAAVAQKDAEIRDLRAAVEAAETARQLAVAEALAAVEKERDGLSAKLDQAERDRRAAEELAAARLESELAKAAAGRDSRIQELEAALGAAESSRKLALVEAVGAVERERDELRNSLERAALEKQLAENSLKDKYETQLKDRDDAIERLRDMKARLSTKMLGETLEQHCETEFNRIRATAFPFAYFEKDNDASSGSKGDFVFRDYDEAGTEYVSIMFEMKNESDTTATKQRNEHFFKELDKDRTEKGCEYAVLVSLLEPESEQYNVGIADVSHRYPKMFVVRPQFFLPIISLLRNASRNSLAYKSELEQIRAQNIDITDFEDKLLEFQDKFGKNFALAQRHYADAIEAIDKSIAQMQKVKEKLQGSEKQLKWANDKAQDVSIKKLTRGNPTMQAKFAELESGSGDQLDGG